MKNPNGYGTVKKLSGNRRRPWAVYIPDGYEMGVKKRSIAFLKDALTPELYQQVETEYNAYIAKNKKAKPKLNPVLLKKIIGHSAQDLTQDTYTHAMIEDLVAEIDKYTL